MKNICRSTNKQGTILDFVINVARNYTLNALQIYYTVLHLAGNAVICIFLCKIIRLITERHSYLSTGQHHSQNLHFIALVSMSSKGYFNFSTAFRLNMF